MLRVVVAVALATVLLGVSMPAVETARVDYAHSRVDAELDTLAATAARLQERNDPAPTDVGGARRFVELHLPAGSWTSAGIARLVIPGPGGDVPPGTVRYRLADGQQRTRSVRAPLVGPPGGLWIAGGRHRLVLEYTRRAGHPVVLVRYPELKSEAATRPGHDTPGPLGPAGKSGTQQ